MRSHDSNLLRLMFGDSNSDPSNPHEIKPSCQANIKNIMFSWLRYSECEMGQRCYDQFVNWLNTKIQHSSLTECLLIACTFPNKIVLCVPNLLDNPASAQVMVLENSLSGGSNQSYGIRKLS